MSDRRFVHLHCHTHYSLLDGASRIPELVALVKELGMNAVAITDHGNLYGAVQFYQKCRSAGVNPIVGYEAYVAPGRRTDRDARRRGDAGFHLTLLARNNTGFNNLVKMASLAYLEGFHFVPRIDKELLEAHAEGLICLSGCASGEFSDLILKGKMEEAEELAAWFSRVFGKHFYVEIQNNGLEIQRLCAQGAIDVANKMGLPLVATCDAHYLRKGDAGAHDVLLCINTGAKRDDEKRLRYGEGDRLVDQFYVRPPEEMYTLFPGLEEAVGRSQEIANGVEIELDFKSRHFPVFTPPEGKSPEDYLRELCHEGLRERYGESPGQEVIDRLEHELGIICRMGFASYFLIVRDFVRFAVEKQIPCSARGSACGALVSYVLRLSHVDPLDYDLLFERFLDPNRSEAPDIDIDFCQERRDDVIAYVREKYGEESVAQIATFGTLAARAAIKDVGRVLNVPFDRVNQLTNMVPVRLGITIDDALKESPELRELYETDGEVKELIDIARKLEGTNRQTGIHAAGVVIADGALMEHVPLHRALRKGQDGGRGSEAVVATQWEMGDLEKVGMLKMDFLGLRTLTVLDNALRLIEETRGEKIDLEKLPLDDAKTYQLLQRGDAKGVFQFESEGIRELLKRLRPDNIRDIIACTALYRPGPLQGGMVDMYINRKHGLEQPTYEHPVMEEVLKETYGILVFQEQIMRVLNRLGGIELSKAYLCIKAISKKKHDIIDQRRADFIAGAKERGVDEKTAEQIFALIVFFGGYGFNKSHSAAYAHISYHTAYLKAHYPAEFMAALLSSEVEDGNKRDILVEHIDDARRMGVDVLPPDINTSESDFTVRDGKIVFGLTAIKGCGRSATEALVKARKVRGAFKDLFDFCERVDTRAVTQAAMERLIKAGAMDTLGGHRAQLVHVLPRALQAAKDRQEDHRLGQGNLFEGLANGEVHEEVQVEELPDVARWEEREKLAYEKEVLDFYFSSHPLAQYEKDLARLSADKVVELKNVPPGKEVTLGGMIVGLRLMNTKKARNGNSRYARFRFEDLSGSIECVFWPDDYVRYKDEVKEDEPRILKGVIEKVRDDPSLVVSKVMGLEQAQREFARGLFLLMPLSGSDQLLRVDAVAEVLRTTPGHCPVHLVIRDGLGRKAHLKLAQEFWIDPSRYDKDRLEGILGSGTVRLT